MKSQENLKVSEYKLMYMFGGWVTKEVICAECDKEAIYDADTTFNSSKLVNWPYSVALWKGNTIVKSYR